MCIRDRTRPLKSTQKERESTSVSDSTQQLLRTVYLLVVVLLVLQVILVILPTYHTVILVHVMVNYLISRGYSGSLCSGKPGGQLLLLLLILLEVLRLIVPLEELVVNSPFAFCGLSAPVILARQ